MNLTIISLTRTGTMLASRLYASLQPATLLAPQRFVELAPGSQGYNGRVAEAVQQPFQEGQQQGHAGLVLIMAMGVAVRALAPLLKDKLTDPAVVVVDEAGCFAISMLSGHLGGANRLANRVAGITGGQAVITTSSDVQGSLSPDLLGQEYGWHIEPGSQVTAASAAVVNGDPVGVWQETGERDWWPADRPLPGNVAIVEKLPELRGVRAALVITDRLLADTELPDGVAAVVYRPRSLSVGVGCNRGTTADEIGSVIDAVLRRASLSPRSVGGLATIDAKSDEPGLLACAASRGWPVRYFSAAELNAVGGLPNPSEVAWRELGAVGVSEPAALLDARASALLVPKQKLGNVTVAVARATFEAGI